MSDIVAKSTLTWKFDNDYLVYFNPGTNVYTGHVIDDPENSFEILEMLNKTTKNDPIQYFTIVFQSMWPNTRYIKNYDIEPEISNYFFTTICENIHFKDDIKMNIIINGLDFYYIPLIMMKLMEFIPMERVVEFSFETKPSSAKNKPYDRMLDFIYNKSPLKEITIRGYLYSFEDVVDIANNCRNLNYIEHNKHHIYEDKKHDRNTCEICGSLSLHESHVKSASKLSQEL